MFLEKQAEISLHSWKLNQLPHSFYLMQRKEKAKNIKLFWRCLSRYWALKAPANLKSHRLTVLLKIRSFYRTDLNLHSWHTGTPNPLLLLTRSHSNSSHLLPHAAIPSQLLFAMSALSLAMEMLHTSCSLHLQWGATVLLASELNQHSTEQQKMRMNLSTATLVDGEQEDLLVQPMRSTISSLLNNRDADFPIAVFGKVMN